MAVVGVMRRFGANKHRKRIEGKRTLLDSKMKPRREAGFGGQPGVTRVSTLSTPFAFVPTAIEAVFTAHDTDAAFEAGVETAAAVPESLRRFPGGVYI